MLVQLEVPLVHVDLVRRAPADAQLLLGLCPRLLLLLRLAPRGILLRLLALLLAFPLLLLLSFPFPARPFRCGGLLRPFRRLGLPASLFLPGPPLRLAPCGLFLLATELFGLLPLDAFALPARLLLPASLLLLQLPQVFLQGLLGLVADLVVPGRGGVEGRKDRRS
ncbi:hypothetical protein VTN02DRAFT_504 [Thermoascus thermophilus]